MRSLLLLAAMFTIQAVFGSPKLDDEVVVFETSFGKIVAVLWPQEAPATVANFKKLISEKFYDGTSFHRVIKDFLVQGGDPLSRDPRNRNVGTGGPGYFIKAEHNNQPHTKGVLSMARDERNPDSAGSQFFFCLKDRPELNGKYTAFGKVIEGFEVLDQIAGVEVTFNHAGERSLPITRVGLNLVKLEKQQEYAEVIARLDRQHRDHSLMEALKGKTTKDPNAPPAATPPPPNVTDETEVLLIKTTLGEMSFVLWDQEAPHAVNYVKNLIRRRYYDETAIHRVIPRFMIQGGCPFSRDFKSRLVGTGGREEAQGVEFEYLDRVPQRGFIGLARQEGDRSSIGTQFFVCLDELPEIQNRYPLFGQLFKGESTLNAISGVEVTYGKAGEKSKPVQPVILNEARLIPAKEARLRP
ncbi:MAG: peptidylprolyl isomerase [Methylacidiphilales bacterium]|nr:peptidylprolyl isomerase [Candidatus Methylacidiphilales bacterium]MDW8348811.1 peptidylprolyl isomerase [Verrucomicrobiae bacterium]